jgi:hypothetical protein
MTTPTSENQTILQVPFHKLEAANGEVRIWKNRAILNRYFGLACALIVLFAVLFWVLPTKPSLGTSNKPFDISKILFLFGISIFIAITIYLSGKRLIRVLSNYTLKWDNGLYINGKDVTLTLNTGAPTVVIQDVAASGGVGGSYTVGIGIGKKLVGLCYELDEVDAAKIASFLSHHLGLRIERKEAAAFPLFKLH